MLLLQCRLSRRWKPRPSSRISSLLPVGSENENYRRAQQYVKTVKVANDPAERGIKLASEYSKILSKDSAIRSLIYQVVENDRTRRPNFKKSTMRGL